MRNERKTKRRKGLELKECRIEREKEVSLKLKEW